MSGICLDTSAYSRFRRGHDECTRAITSATDVSLPVIVLGELRAGFALGSRAEHNHRELHGFLAHPMVRVLDVDDGAANIYAGIFLDLRRAGTPIPTNDIWIAALARRAGAALVTSDRHFEYVRGLDLVLIDD